MAGRSPQELLRHVRRSVINPRIKKLRERLGDNEVRNAKRLLAALRSSTPPDVVAFGDSNWVFRAGYDADQRNLPTMLAAELGPDVRLHVTASAGYYSTLIASYARLIELTGRKPVVIVPICARLASVAWTIHPRYTYAEAIEHIRRIEADTPTRKVKAVIPPPSPEDYARYGAAEITTWAGTMTIDELRAPLLDPAGHGIDETERRRLLYAYHHGEHVEPGAPPLQWVEAMARQLRALDTEVVAFETTVPVEEGVALWGEQFRESAENTLRLMREAFRRGYGDPIDIIECGLTMERSSFIDPADGSEHLNEHGRRKIALLLADATRAALARQAASGDRLSSGGP